MGLLKTILILVHVIPLMAGVTFLVLLESGWIDERLRPERPPIVDKYWGAGSAPAKEDTSVRKFEVKVPDKVLEDLRRRLQSARLTPNLEDVNFSYGSPSAFMETVRSHWLQKYDWRSWEKRLNAFPQFKTRIDGLDIHFLHVKPQPRKGQKVLPLLLMHGWPGSIVEFHKMLPLLTNTSPESPFVFEVVAPSLPGYGWSEASKKAGLSVVPMARLFVKLMERLKLAGPSGFYVQGGDWGAVIGDMMARMQPEKVRGLHLNMLVAPARDLRYFARLLLGTISPGLVLSANDTWKVYPYAQFMGKVIRETGYMHIQATRPDTVGTALNDSPLGLAAYILEKFAAWTDRDFLSKPDGGLSKYFTLDELLTNVMVYWTTASITSSVRLYKESIPNIDDWWQIPSPVPTGAAAFPNELAPCPEPWFRINHPNLIHYTDMPRGGHFAALEEPQLLADDFAAFVGKTEAFYVKKAEKEAERAKTDL